MNASQQFYHLSQLVTGFGELSVDVTEGYYQKLSVAEGYRDHLDSLLQLASACATTEELISKVSNQQQAFCKGLAFLWYASELISWASANSALLDKDRAPASEREYYSGLIWQAIRAHPLGLSGGYYGYWKYEPEN
ncbi:MAG: hypothetical protein J7527_16840 [Chitinophagaceae bacterium]|nr:hypothetical protein [Chitinophagaceae bacterium]